MPISIFCLKIVTSVLTALPPLVQSVHLCLIDGTLDEILESWFEYCEICADCLPPSVNSVHSYLLEGTVDLRVWEAQLQLE